MISLKIKEFFKNTDNCLLFCVSIISAANSLFLLAATYKNLEAVSFLKFEYIYAIYFFAAILFLYSFWSIFKKTRSFLPVWKKAILTFLLTEVVLLSGFFFGAYFNYALKILAGLYLIGVFFYAVFKIKGYSNFRDFYDDIKDKDGSENISKKFKSKKTFAYVVLVSVAALNLSFGFYHITKFSAVDEPLWTDGRIAKYWNNIKQGELERTNISDKPGITVALVSGIGLNFVNPRDYKIDHQEGKVLPTGANIEKMYLALRTPIFLFNFLMLFVLYSLIKKLLGKEVALISFIFISLSPILLGISKIINPDSLIWTLAPCSLLSYFLYLGNGKNKFLYLTGIFLGFSILTKYVANILYVFFAMMIFIEYLANSEKYSKISVRDYLKNKFLDYFIISFLSLFIFYIFFPAAWIKLEYLLQGTIFSQAFQKVWIVFIGFIALVLADLLIFKSRIFANILNFFLKFKKMLPQTIMAAFIVFVFIALINVLLGMKWFDFESIVATPKTAFRESGFLGLFLANFYSLIFGIAPVAIFSIILIGIKNIFKIKNKNNYIIFSYIALFILFYYLASSVNLISATVRYQIIIFPLALIMASIGIYELVNLEKIRKYVKINYLYFLLIIVSIYSLNFIRPFYFSYASGLLPEQNVLNLKDMGDGSYEAAKYLNSLPNAGEINVWSDKRGVCAFFKGACYSGFDFKVSEMEFDYFIISSGRETKAINNLEPRVKRGVHAFIRFDKLYSTDIEPEFKLEIGNRPNNFVKIYSASQVEKINQ